MRRFEIRQALADCQQVEVETAVEILEELEVAGEVVETVVAANPAAEEIAHVVYNVQNVEAAVLEA